MRIGIDIRHLAQKNPTGVGRYTIELINALAHLRPNDEFFLFATGARTSRKHIPAFPQKNITVVEKNCSNRLFTLKILLGIAKPLESHLPKKIDFWIFPNLNHIKTALPYALTIHDVSFKLFPKFFTTKSILWHKTTRPQALIQNAAVILAVSKSTKNSIKHFFRCEEEKITTTPLGVSPNFFTKNKTPNTPPYFLVLGTLEPRKNIDSIIKAYKIYKEKNPNAPKLVITGMQGWKNSDKEQFASPEIEFTGYVDEITKQTYIKNATALFFTSFYEGFGLPALEAMASGTPVVLSNISALTEIAEEAVIYIDPYNIHDTVAAFSILENSELREKLSEKGRKQAQQFTWEKTAQKTWNAIEKSIKNHPHARS